MDKSQYSLRLSDFVPVKGFLDYTERTDNPPLHNSEDFKNIGKACVLGIYNSLIIGTLAFAGLKGLEQLVK